MTAIAMPSVSRTAWSTMKSPRALGHVDAECDGAGVGERFALGRSLLESTHDRSAAVGLHGDQPRERPGDPAELSHLVQRFPDPDQSDAAAGGAEDDVG